jgi:hypothetical protein
MSKEAKENLEKEPAQAESVKILPSFSEDDDESHLSDSRYFRDNEPYL